MFQYLFYSTAAGQNVFFFGGGGGQLGQVKPRGVRGEYPLKFLEFSFLKSLQMHPITLYLTLEDIR